MASRTSRQARKGTSKITDLLQSQKRLLSESEGEDEITKDLLAKKRNTMDPSTSLGDFKHLPSELRMLLFEKISVKSLAALAMSCRQLHREIWDYVFQSKVGKKRFQAECLVQKVKFCLPCGKGHTITQSQPTKNFANWGVLLKVTTCVYSTNKRILMIAEFFHVTTKTMELMVNSSLMKGWGKLFMKVVGDWDLMECERVFHAVMAHDNHRVANLIRAVLDASPGQMPEDEFLVRIVLQSLFLDHAFTDPEDYPFYLSQILDPFSIPHQAKLVFILYAPVIKERIQFRALCDVPVTDHLDRTLRLWPFANCILALHSELCPYSDDDIISLLEELTTFPDVWALDNLSGLLLLMPEIALDAVRSRVFFGQVEESVDILNSMKTQAFRWQMQLTMETLMQQLREAIQSVPWTPQVKRSISERLSCFIGTAHQSRLDHIIASNTNRAEIELDMELLSYRYVMLMWRERFAKDSL